MENYRDFQKALADFCEQVITHLGHYLRHYIASADFNSFDCVKILQEFWNGVIHIIETLDEVHMFLTRINGLWK